MIEQKPFRQYILDEDKEETNSKVFTIRLNDEEIKNLVSAQNILQQEKTSTTIKQLVTFAMFVLQERSTAQILDILGNNIRKNKRIGIDYVNVKEPKN